MNQEQGMAAAEHLRQALVIIDAIAAPGQIGANVDLALQQLLEWLGQPPAEFKAV